MMTWRPDHHIQVKARAYWPPTHLRSKNGSMPIMDASTDVEEFIYHLELIYDHEEEIVVLAGSIDWHRQRLEELRSAFHEEPAPKVRQVNPDRLSQSYYSDQQLLKHALTMLDHIRADPQALADENWLEENDTLTVIRARVASFA
jgi:hypothetical protein